MQPSTCGVEMLAVFLPIVMTVVNLLGRLSVFLMILCLTRSVWQLHLINNKAWDNTVTLHSFQFNSQYFASLHAIYPVDLKHTTLSHLHIHTLSKDVKMVNHLLIPSWFSILAIILMFLPFSPMILRISRMPSADRINEANTMSTCM